MNIKHPPLTNWTSPLNPQILVEANSNNISPPVDQCLNLVPIHNQTSSCKIQYFPVVLYLFAAYSLTVYVQNAIQSTDINEIQRVAEIYNRAILFCDDMFLTILNIFNIIRISLSLLIYIVCSYILNIHSPLHLTLCPAKSIVWLSLQTHQRHYLYFPYFYTIFFCVKDNTSDYIWKIPLKCSLTYQKIIMLLYPMSP